MINQARGSSVQRPASPHPSSKEALAASIHHRLPSLPPAASLLRTPHTPKQTVSVLLRPSHLGLNSGRRFRTYPGAGELPRPDHLCPLGGCGPRLPWTWQGLAQRQHPGAAVEGDPGLENDGRDERAEAPFLATFISLCVQGVGWCGWWWWWQPGWLAGPAFSFLPFFLKTFHSFPA